MLVQASEWRCATALTIIAVHVLQNVIVPKQNHKNKTKPIHKTKNNTTPPPPPPQKKQSK